MSPTITDGNERFEVKIVAAFLGLKFLPKQIALAFNNFNPKLIFLDTIVEYRAFLFTNRLVYHEIEKVDILLTVQTTNVYLIKGNSILTISANTNDEDELYKCLRILKVKGCTLSEKAEHFYSKYPNIRSTDIE